MTVEQLLQPRAILTNNFPGNIDCVGTLYTFDMNDGWDVDFYETCKECPANFRFLEWHERRKPTEMPEYIKLDEGAGTNKKNAIIKVDSWTDSFHFVTNGVEFSLTPLLLPATKEEYDNFVNNKTQ